MIMLREVTAEIMKLVTNLTFARNLSLTTVVAIASLCGLAELQSQNIQLTQQTSITNISNSSSIKIIVVDD